ncbi:hypothetical protein H0H92_006057 [Tricholoma furcatifolium]|nr:hypothetical protein H0H92_006057 [Tricholoma furcatifolium]
MPVKTLLERIRFAFTISGFLYAALIGLLTVPFFQSHVLYLNAFRFPFFARFDIPEKYGLAPNKALNFYIKTPDNETLGAWFVLSDEYYQSLSNIPTELNTHVSQAVHRHPTILFFHGNAATRAFKARVLHYEAYSSRLGANVLAIDYRGFADSTGTPSETGLVTDAHAAWDWLLQLGTKEDDILIVGHSLGTGVASQLAAQLSEEGFKPRGVVLLSRIKASVLIAHAEDDWDIPYTHSRVLFDAFLKPCLPQLDVPEGLSVTEELWEKFQAQHQAWNTKRSEIVATTIVPKFGTVEKFEADGRQVVLVQTLFGGHDLLGVQEATLIDTQIWKLDLAVDPLVARRVSRDHATETFGL